MVARLHAHAFFGLPPAPLRPKAPVVRPLSIRTRVSRPVFLSQTRPWNSTRAPSVKADYNYHGDLYGVSSEEEDLLESNDFGRFLSLNNEDVRVDSPVINLPTQGPLGSSGSNQTRRGSTAEPVTPSSSSSTQGRTTEPIRRTQVRYVFS
jgi:hypothetical protein